MFNSGELWADHHLTEESKCSWGLLFLDIVTLKDDWDLEKCPEHAARWCTFIYPKTKWVCWLFAYINGYAGVWTEFKSP